MAEGIGGAGPHAHLRGVFLAIIFPLIELALVYLGFGCVVVALEAIGHVSFWHHVGRVMHQKIKDIMPARLAAIANKTITATTNWRTDWGLCCHD